RPAVEAGRRAGECIARPPFLRLRRRDRTEDVVAGRGERDLGAGVREVGALAGDRAGGNREAVPALPVRAGRLEGCGRVLDRVALVELVSGGRDEQDVVRGRVLDGTLLEGRGSFSADREVDD